jgi:hypothetical protein
LLINNQCGGLLVEREPAGNLVWRQGMQCDSGACVEAAGADDQVVLRSSASPDGAWLTLSRAEWVAFVDSVKDGLFDSL